MRSGLLSVLCAMLRLTAGLRVTFGGRASPLTMMAATDARCALIDLSAEEPKRVAQVLKKAWMEGGVKVCACIIRLKCAPVSLVRATRHFLLAAWADRDCVCA